MPRTIETAVDMGIVPSAKSPDFNLVPHDGTGRLRFASVDVWKPTRGQKLELEPIEKRILDLNQRFGLTSLCYDPWQCEYLAQRLSKQRVRTEQVPFVPGNLQSMATATLEAFVERRIDLFDHPSLRRDLAGTQVVERQYGIRLDSPRGPGGHGDTATALALALHGEKRFKWNAGPPRINRPLVLWDPRKEGIRV